MTDTLVSVSPNGSQPSPYRVDLPNYRWEHFESSDPEEQELYGGFAVKVRTNPNYGELLQARRLLDDDEEKYWQFCAPRILEWNAWAADESGNESPIPAPGEHPDNWRAVYALERPLVVWLIRLLSTAHLGGETRKNLSSAFAERRARGNAPINESRSNEPSGNESP